MSYVQRVNISITAKYMMEDLQLTQIQMGQVFSSFMIGYALFQIPAGALGDRWGPRKVLAVAALAWVALTVLTGIMPGRVGATSAAALVSLIILRFLLGAAQAATYPVAARTVGSWVPASQRALANSIVLAGMPLGSAITPPLVAWVMVTIGWRESFYLTAGLGLTFAIIWAICARDHPTEHPRVNNHELRLLSASVAESRKATAPLAILLKRRNVQLLSLSYFLEGYVLFIFVFWFYIYLIDVRGFTALGGGVMAALPWLISLVSTPLGGVLCDFLAAKRGRLSASRIVVLSMYVICAALLFVGASAENRYVAVFALSFSIGFLMSAEPAFWSSAIHVGASSAGTVSGIMNAAGILGGVISTALVPVLVQHYGWLFALGSGSFVALLCCAVWLAIRDSRVELNIAEVGAS